ncbi:MAG: sensor histidine kinase N-terminal domain-containing protein [Methylococcaceae bacterium]|nr:sensor histidine kinase N-terminal domain-containing protein [Methylococcaceae bacterium]MDZ4155687.1 sensor histidine kinase N-terminal domain-containing protein [Methylococcales bacterium]MDP2392178.1 sensor histidine kinase N-terminal domain-containing protein [Methylococcaceae bacterium]MDP3018636.1 sensor histidine kinase N-terminal domain-containing protein [Methylococcaceae bacterium]MDP3390567.1 sensor histidine kinase N-terminal domain-containing protein [Methylococcaceae bacterium]
MNNPRSLKSVILLRLAIPLIIFMALETVVSYFVTLHYVDNAYDRWLLDSARSLTQEIKLDAGKVVVDLPPEALEIFKWDESDKTYFKIISAQQGVIAGDKFVPEPFDDDTDWTRAVFLDETMYGEPVRVVSMMLPTEPGAEKIFVHVAETVNKRRAMMIDILLADLVPQLILVLVVGLFLLRGIKRGLQPLQLVANEIAQRSPRDLRPIPERHVYQEVQVLTNTINELLQRLAHGIASQQRFIANAAHQLRTPLAGLKLQAARALREQNVEAMQPALEQIQNSADRMAHLTSQLLVLARSEPIEGDYELVPVDLVELARSTCMEFVPKALQRNIELGFESDEPALIIKGDAILLRELLANLLDNAITYGHEHGNILIKLERNPTPCLIVEDDGPGIPESERQRIFERFYRIPGTSGVGCGLGLAIVKEIADLHKARLQLRPFNERVGTRIELKFD